MTIRESKIKMKRECKHKYQGSRLTLAQKVALIMIGIFSLGSIIGCESEQESMHEYYMRTNPRYRRNYNLGVMRRQEEAYERRKRQEEQDSEAIKQITVAAIGAGLLDSQLGPKDALTARALGTGITEYNRDKAIRESGTEININLDSVQSKSLGTIEINNIRYEIAKENDWAYLLKAPDGEHYILKKEVLEEIRERQKEARRTSSYYAMPDELPLTFTCLDFQKDETGPNILELDNIFDIRNIRNTKGSVAIVTRIYKSPLEWRCEILNSEKEVIDEGQGLIEKLEGLVEGNFLSLPLLFKPEEHEKEPFGLKRYEFRFYEDGKEIPEKSTMFYINYNQK